MGSYDIITIHKIQITSTCLIDNTVTSRTNAHIIRLTNNTNILTTGMSMLVFPNDCNRGIRATVIKYEKLNTLIGLS